MRCRPVPRRLVPLQSAPLQPVPLRPAWTAPWARLPASPGTGFHIGPPARILPSMANKPAGAANRKDGADPAAAGRIKQIRMVAGIIRKSNPRALPLVALAGVGVLAVFVIVGLFTGLLGLLIPLGLLCGLTAAMVLFGRYAQSAQYKAVEGQP